MSEERPASPRRYDCVTIFPEMLTSFMGFGIPRRAVEGGYVALHGHDLRDHAGNKHRTVDDYPYGGGGGMVLRPQPLFDAVAAIREETGSRGRVVLTSARGRLFDQDLARELAEEEHLIFLCGHYKGVDARVETLCDDEVSIGDYCLSGGEVATMVVLDAIIRLIPGVVGTYGSIVGDSHYEGLLGPPEYTRPEEYRGMKVPPVLLSGHHARVEAWRREKALELTRARRPDLLDDEEDGGGAEGAK